MCELSPRVATGRDAQNKIVLIDDLLDHLVSI